MIQNLEAVGLDTVKNEGYQLPGTSCHNHDQLYQLPRLKFSTHS